MENNLERSDKTYTVTCLDSKYDTNNGMMVLVCKVHDINESRIFYFNKQDFHYGDPAVAVPDAEMDKTAKMFVNKTFNIVINDDPDREKITEENIDKYIDYFASEIGDTLDEIEKGLADEDQVMIRNIGRIIEKDNKKDLNSMLKNELFLRGKLGNIIKG